jgi:type I restriction enzyme M protein
MTFPDIVKATSSDWIYNSLLLSTLKETGKAYAIMTNGSTWNGTDKSIREYFVRKGFIETIISLPANMFSGMSMATTLIVLSYGNSSVRMIDASKIFIVGRRQNIFSDENIALIVNLLSTDTENSALVSFDDIAKNDYVINPSRYLAEEIEIKDGVEFGSVIKRITRGAPLRAEELDKMVSLEPTMYQYLMLANIKDGIIDENLPYIKDIDQKLEKYCIKNNSLVLSKNGAPFKVAVAEVEEGKKILGNGNLYIIELDEEKINPFYLKAFFDSEIGETVLKRIAVGAKMPNITVEALKKINVPMPTMEKQIQVVERTRAKMDEVKVLRLRLERAIQSMKTFFEED